jgi:phosphoribosylanthranilate isomerase
MTRVKICGLMTEHDICLCTQAGADALGFVTEYPVPVPWNLDRERSRELIAKVPPFVTTTAVVGGPKESILKIVDTVKPQVVQLHADETKEDIAYICGRLSEIGVQVIKALRIDVDTQKAQFAIEDPEKAALALCSTGIAALAVDSKTSGRPAGTGVPLDWKIIQSISAAIPIPLILAGGLNVDNVTAAISFVKPYGVDIISGVEKTPGIKDPDKVHKFVRTVKALQSSIKLNMEG